VLTQRDRRRLIHLREASNDLAIYASQTKYFLLCAKKLRQRHKPVNTFSPESSLQEMQKRFLEHSTLNKKRRRSQTRRK
jgi:hypothetical protein